MTRVFRILQLKGLGLPQGEIASSCAVSKSTVSKVLKKASELPDEPNIYDFLVL